MAGVANDPHRPALPLFLGGPLESRGSFWWILPGSPDRFSETACACMSFTNDQCLEFHLMERLRSLTEVCKFSNGTGGHGLSCFHTPIYTDAPDSYLGVGGGSMAVAVYREVNEALPSLPCTCGKIGEDQVPSYLPQGASPHLLTSPSSGYSLLPLPYPLSRPSLANHR